MHSSFAFLCKKKNSVGVTLSSSCSQAEPITGPAVSDEEYSEDSSASLQHALAQEKKRQSPADGDRQYFWRDGHQDTMAAFWLSHPIFYDKAQQHHKNKEMRLQLMQELIQQNCETWEKLHSPLPTGE